MNKVITEDLEYIYEHAYVDWNVFRNKTILISGAYGMLPSYIVFYLNFLNTKGFNINIICIGRNPEKAKIVFKDFFDDKNFRFEKMDVCDFDGLDVPIDYIIHGASYASSQFYGSNPVGTILPNMLGTYKLLEYARNQKVSGFLFFSSSEIYGNIGNSEIINENNYGSIDPLDIRSCYSESKRMGETLCKSYFCQYGVPAKIVRIFHTYGPTMDIQNDKRVFAEFVSSVVNNRNIEIKSDGLSMRSFCYIADAVAAYLKVLVDGLGGEAYNVANPETLITIKELAETIAELFPERNLQVMIEKRVENDNYIENKAISNSNIDVSKIKKLGWKPGFSVSKGFQRTINGIEESRR